MINSSGLPYREYSEAVAVAKETNEQVLELRVFLVLHRSRKKRKGGGGGGGGWG